ncbi:hypothetical protein ACS0TY_005795 [Phlomoides rotata]
MSEDKNLSEQLDTFNRYVDDLEDLDVKLEDDDKTLMLLNALPRSLENFKDAVLFGRQDQVSYDGVLTAVKTKILQVHGRDSKSEKKTHDPSESLNVKFKKGGKKSFKGRGGCVFEANGDSISVMKGGKILMKGERSNGRYILDGKTVSGSANSDMSSADTLLWHKRLGHVKVDGNIAEETTSVEVEPAEVNQEGEPAAEAAADPAEEDSSSAEDDQNLRHYSIARDIANGSNSLEDRDPKSVERSSNLSLSPPEELENAEAPGDEEEEKMKGKPPIEVAEEKTSG